MSRRGRRYKVYERGTVSVKTCILRVRVAVLPRILCCVPPDPLEVAGAFLMGFSHIKIMLMSRITLLDEIKTFLSGCIISLVEV